MITNKIDAIKRLREFTQHEFGAPMGLLEAKHAIESIQANADKQAITSMVDVIRKLPVLLTEDKAINFFNLAFKEVFGREVSEYQNSSYIP